MGIKNRILRVVLAVSLLIALSSSQSFYKLYKHDGKSNAKCLDGSPSALYISEGASGKILIYFEGGGMCSGMTLADTLENCYQRSKTSFGSSKSYLPAMDFHSFTVLSNDKTINPLYHNWTKVFVPYCDGVLHQGTRASAIDYKGVQLYIKGMDNTQAHFEYLNQTYHLYSAS